MIRRPSLLTFAVSLLAALICLPGTSLAATFCVTTSAELQAALDATEINGQADVIRIATGTYQVPAGGGFRHDAAAPVGGDDQDIEISGGWTVFFDNPCGQQLDSTDVFQTALDGNDQFRVLDVRVRDNADVRVNRLTFRFGLTTTAPQRGAGLRIDSGDNHVATILIDRCAFLSNESAFGSALSMQRGGTIRIRNSLFALNHARNGFVVETIMADHVGVYFTNNTVMNNTSDSTDGGAYVATSGTAESFVANNILWENDGADITLVGNKNTFKNNDFQDRSGGTATTDTQNISVAPVFDTGIFNFTPADGSVLIDAGANAPSFVPVPPPFNQNWSMGARDLYGSSRVRGERVDIGAGEGRSVLLIDGFESP